MTMNFKKALEILEIEEYGEIIFKSNSNGELFHLQQYIYLAEMLKEMEKGIFKRWFENIVKYAYENWERPITVFQHIKEILMEDLKNNKL